MLLTFKAKRESARPDLEINWLDDVEQAVLETDDREIFIDFSPIKVICSKDLSELIRLQAKLRQSGRSLVLDNVQVHLWNVFTVTRLDRLFKIRQSAELHAS